LRFRTEAHRLELQAGSQRAAYFPSRPSLEMRKLSGYCSQVVLKLRAEPTSKMVN
jgi:hypothetical protein